MVGPDAPTLDVGSGDGVAPDEELEEQGEGGSCTFASGPGGLAAWPLLLSVALLGLARVRRRSACRGFDVVLSLKPASLFPIPASELQTARSGGYA